MRSTNETTHNLAEFKLYDFENPKLNSIIFKVTSYCNQRCDYCYTHYTQSDEISKPKVMSIDTVYKIIASYATFVDKAEINFKNMYLVWHGGEPLLAGKSYFSEIMEIEKEFTQSGYKISNGVQTNGILIDEEWISFFKENNFWVGVSMDGPKRIHNAHRHYRKGKSSFEAIYPNLMLLKENKIPLSVISVITEENVGHCKEIFEFFNKLEISSIDFIPCFLYGNEMTLDPKSYSKFMIELFDLWAASPNKNLKIRFLNDIKKKINWLKAGKGTIYTGCELAGRCGENFSILPNGDIYPCECLTPLNSLKLGNIEKIDLHEIYKTKKFDEFKILCNDINPECFSCEVFDICKGGCLNRRLPEFTTDTKDFYCDARKKIIRHVMDKMNEESAMIVL